MRSVIGEMKSDGSGATAQLADQHLPWLSWWALIKDVNDSSLAVVAAHAGVISEPDVRSAKTEMIAG
jgi:hypothetical protein